MIVVKVWCLPSLLHEELTKVHDEIVAALGSIQELGVRSKKDILVIFVPHLKACISNAKILVEISGRPDSPHSWGLTWEPCMQATRVVGKAVAGCFPHLQVQCEAYRPSPSDGYWNSSEE